MIRSWRRRAASTAAPVQTGMASRAPASCSIVLHVESGFPLICGTAKDPSGIAPRRRGAHSGPRSVLSVHTAMTPGATNQVRADERAAEAGLTARHSWRHACFRLEYRPGCTSWRIISLVKSMTCGNRLRTSSSSVVSSTRVQRESPRVIAGPLLSAPYDATYSRIRTAPSSPSPIVAAAFVAQFPGASALGANRRTIIRTDG
jgi:hypothetical protein